MTQVSPEQTVVTVKPQPDVYTVLLIIGILVLGVAVGLVLYTLLSQPPGGYGLPFGALFDAGQLPDPIRPPGK